MEQRRLLSVITWVNRNTTSGDGDNRFAEVFGDRAEAAKAVVDAAITSWARLITSFNYSGATQYEMTISMAATGTSSGAGAGPTGFTTNHKPFQGAMTIGRGNDGPDVDVDLDGDGKPDPLGDGLGYFLDPTPFESSEFQDSTTNAFAAYAGAASPAFGQADLYELVLHELGHAMGFLPTNEMKALSTNTFIPDAIDSALPTPPIVPPIGNYWRFDGGVFQPLLTSYDSGGGTAGPFDSMGPQHFAPAGAQFSTGGVTYRGADDLMTPYYSSSQRRQISQNDLGILLAAYGYTTTESVTGGKDAGYYGTAYDTLDGDGTLRITLPGNGDDQVSIQSTTGGVTTVTLGLGSGTRVLGADPGTIFSVFDSSAIRQIDIDTGPGSDTITIGTVSAPAIRIFAGPADADTLVINAAAGANTLTSDSFASNAQNITALRGIEFVTINGTAFDEDYYVDSTPAEAVITIKAGGGTNRLNVGTRGAAAGAVNSTITFVGGTGDDTVNIGSGNLDVLAAAVNFDGVAGINDRANLNDQASTGPVRYLIQTTKVQRTRPSGPAAVAALSFANLDRLVLNCGSGDDTVTLAVGPTLPIELHGNGGFDTIVFDDHLGFIGRTWNINPDQVIIDGALTATNEFEAVSVLAGINGDQINFSGGHTQSFFVDAGPGADTITIGSLSQVRFSSSGGPVLIYGGIGDDHFVWRNGSNNWFELLFGTFTDAVTLDGGPGTNSLVVDDTTRANTSYQLYPDRFYAFEPAAFPAGSDFKYAGMATVDVTCSNGNNPVAVFGTAPTSGVTTFNLGGGTDAVTIFPHDAAGNLTLVGGLSLNGGTAADTLIVDDTGSSRAITYAVDTPFGPLATRIMGLGSGNLFLAPDVEAMVLNGGGGNDVFRVHSLQTGSAIRMNGGGGDDAVEVAPSSKKLEGNLTNASLFWFDGGSGTNNTFTLFNQSTALGWTYTRPLGSMLAAAPTYGAFRFTLSNEQHTVVRSGTMADTYRLVASAPGVRNEFFGGGGNDMIALGGAAAGGVSPAVAAGLVLDSIHGEVLFDGEADADSITLDDSGSVSGKTAHLKQTTVGADPQDTLFGAGGSFQFANSERLELYLGSGGDTVVAQPNATAAIGIDAGTPGAEPDSLAVDLAGGVNPVFTPFVGISGGTFRADNRRSLTVTYFESVTSFVGAATVAGRHLFYSNSSFDHGAGAEDDGAIAPDKVALLPGQTATAANLSNYSRGINGIMVDILGLPPGRELTATDFELATGGTNDTTGWSAAPAPSSISVRPGAGEDGSDRITLLWPDGAIKNTWLRFVLLANANTGLSSPDVFCYGNLVGDTGNGGTTFVVNALDLGRVRAAQLTAAGISSPLDFNHDGIINALDLGTARANQLHGLSPLSVPPPVLAAGTPERKERATAWL